MKELSIEKKAEHYDEALAMAKECITYVHDDAVNKYILNIFPELKESEDERIRKAIIKCLKWLRDEARWTDIYDISFNSIFAWLEKQGEQKSVDKVEPKFHEGDWITFYGSTAFEILKLEADNHAALNYLLLGQHGNASCYDKEYVDKNTRLWTIQDAKDGDVLTTDTWTFIFKKYQDKSVYYHCAASAFNDFSISDTGEFDSNYVHPATKEQQEILFMAMKDAGYTFDFDKKELKKIVTPKFNVHDCIIKKHNSNINDFGSFIITDITGGKYWYNDRIICDILEQDEWELYEPVRQNTAKWSEEDENRFNNPSC